MIRKILASFRGASADRKGVSAAEYAILAVGIVIVVGSAVVAFKTPLKTAFESVASQITSQRNSVSSR